MAMNEELAQRMRVELKGLPDLVEKKMFGGIGFLVRGNMACGVHGDDLIVRIGPEKYAGALAFPHVHPFDMTGRPMTGWITVDAQGYTDNANLRDWIRQGLEFAATLPAK